MKKIATEFYVAPQCDSNEGFQSFSVLCTSGGATTEPFQEDFFEM